MEYKMPEYIPRTLKEFGNVVVSKKFINRFGQKKLIDRLQEDGLPCNLHILSDGRDVTPSFCNRSKKRIEDPTYILERK
ncbi:MAG: hypothetical protein RR788_07995 [Erysipelotrichaceae bacterium]